MANLCRSTNFNLPSGFLQPSLRLSHKYTDQMREANTQAVLGLKKLHLILDLDHTLLHTVRFSYLTPEEKKKLKAEAKRNMEGGGPAGSSDIFLDSTSEGFFITKLRPFVREFLREADKMFELTVYTMGRRAYLSMKTKLLDPDGQYFGNRLIAREDCTLKGGKSLDVVLAKESNVLILDDTVVVWPDHAENLIPVEPFYYFSHGSQKRGVQPSIIHNKGEHEGGLVTALRVLKEIHERYFNSELGLKGEGDVRELVQRVQSGVRERYGDQAAPPEDAP
ncbi:RNA polymerase II C-terminal domain phosphatase-like 4 [Eucalyptus grandis]|uniref:RNA polymerase II C-terminal domain phosphatase-like 4 n=1 Tax=Eucalyptus grandis TaxID=71139 RepID=UPI00192EE700|nr:RNA polymerase II C-terminal domain phosphatase-like 4 [Eucalyptus grandis]